MSSSLVPEMLAVLKPFLESFKRPREDPGPLFGHIVVPHYAIDGMSQAIHDLIPVDRTTTTFFYINVDEKVESEDGELSIETFSFAEFLEILRRNIIKGEGLWKEASTRQDWLGGRILPKKSVLVIQLSPQVSAESALVLTCVVDRACAAFPWDTRVLTLSSQRPHNFLEQLVLAKEDVPDVRLCDLESVCLQDPLARTHMFNARCLEQISKELHDVIKEPNTNSRLILSFDEGISDHLFSLLGDEDNGSFERFYVFASDVPSDLYELKGIANPRKTVVATVLGHFDHLPWIMDSFQELHLVLGRIDATTPAWDNKSQQVLSYPHWTSKQDRTSQLWWAYQPEGVAVTVYSAKYTPEDFVKNGASHVRLVQGAHLGGYIAAAIDLMSFGVGSNETIDLFVQNPSIVELIKTRLALQTLVSNDGLNLSNTEVRLFWDVLPKFNYDYRFAMLFALDCNPAVRRLKAYFIAMLIGGTHCRFKNSGITSQDVNDVFRASRAHGSSLVRYGTTWMMLGLLKLVFSGPTGSNDRNTLTGIVQYDMDSVEMVYKRYYDLLHIFIEHGLNPDTLPFQTAEPGLSKDDKLRFHTDLFLAYMHQAVLYRQPNGRNDSNHEPEFKSLTSMQSCGFSLGTDALSLLFNPQRVTRQMGDEGWYGISHKLSRSSASLTFHDWIVIPAEVVALWSEETGLTPSDLASTVVDQNSASIEVMDQPSVL